MNTTEEQCRIHKAIGSIRGLADTTRPINAEEAEGLRDYFDGASKRCLADLGLPADTLLVDPPVSRL